jgi:hypothetical protein
VDPTVRRAALAQATYTSAGEQLRVTARALEDNGDQDLAEQLRAIAEELPARGRLRADALRAQLRPRR